MKNSRHRRDNFNADERHAHAIRIGRMRAARQGKRFAEPTHPSYNPATKLRHN